MSNSEPLIFFGTEDFSAAILKRLLKEGWPVEAVVTQPDAPSGRGRRVTSPEVKNIAMQAGIKVWQPTNAAGLGDKLALDRSRWGVLAAYGQIIPASILDRFEAVINVHPSLLPRYRGPSPIETTILEGDKETGVSIIKLVPRMDAGPIYVQQSVPLAGDINRQELSKQLAELGADLLLGNLHNIINGQLAPVPQKEEEATYTKLIDKADGLVDWSKPAQQIEKEVRAYFGWPKSRAKLKHFDVILTRVKVVAGPEAGKLVQSCGKGWLEIIELIAPSGRLISGADFMRGYLEKS